MARRALSRARQGLYGVNIQVKNIFKAGSGLRPPKRPPPLATGTLRPTAHLAVGAAKGGAFWVVLGEIGCRAANLAENTGNTANLPVLAGPSRGLRARQ